MTPLGAGRVMTPPPAQQQPRQASLPPLRPPPAPAPRATPQQTVSTAAMAQLVESARGELARSPVMCHKCGGTRACVLKTVSDRNKGTYGQPYAGCDRCDLPFVSWIWPWQRVQARG